MEAVENKSFFQRVFPKRGNDAAAFMFMIIMMWFIAGFEFFAVLPNYHEVYSPIWWFHVCLALFMFVNVFANFFRVILVDTSGRRLGLPAVLKPGWKYCPFCQINSPPRSHHCHACDVCVLKRDHHCIFAGQCVGYANYRYYMFLVIYLWLGAIYANYYHWEYAKEQLGPFGFTTIFTMFVPFLTWLFGYCTIYQFFVTLMVGLSMFSLVLFSGLLFFQLRIIFRGQTSYERKKNRRLYDQGWKQNFVEVFGQKWYLSWIWPFIPSHLPGDGTNYKPSESFETQKDM
mgnify:CR=1 FL=1